MQKNRILELKCLLNVPRANWDFLETLLFKKPK
jgi:hypothetical protein